MIDEPVDDALRDVRSPRVTGCPSSRADRYEFSIPASVDIILVPRHYHPSFGGLQNFTTRLASALVGMNRRILVVSAEESPNSRAHHVPQTVELLPHLTVHSPDRSAFWESLCSAIERASPDVVVLAIGLEQPPVVSAQLRALAAITASGRTSVLRVATTSDFGSRVTGALVGVCRELDAIVILNSEMQREVEAVLSQGSSCEVRLIPVIGGERTDRHDVVAGRERWRQEKNIPSSAFVALWAGRPVPRKRLLFLLEIWRRAARHGFLILVGVDPDDVSPVVKELVAFLGEHRLDNVRLVPPLSKALMREAYAAANCFVFTSEREGMSNAVVEALYNGLPVLASDFPGMREIQRFVPSAPMRLFPDADEDAFVQALREQTESGESDAFEEVRRVFSARAIAERYDELFRGLLRRGTRQDAPSSKNCSAEVSDV